MVTVDPALIDGVAFTETTFVPVPVQPFVVPAIVYVMVDVGLAVTLAPVVADNAVAGDHV
jgi:hypothetical protein